MENQSIKVGITHGDPNGVGYEIIMKAIAEEGITDMFTPVVFGIPSLAEKAKQQFGFQNVKLHVVKDATDVKEGKINVVALGAPDPEFHPGEVRKDAGESSVKALEKAVESLKAGLIDVLVTAPISKEAVQSEDFRFPGHTEYLTDRLGEGSEAMMILCDAKLRVALLTKHVPVNRITENISQEKVEKTIESFSTTLKKDFGIVRPRIAVLSLNPHAGDGGLLGSEEEEILKPAIQEVQQKGILAFGPFAADGFFGHANYKHFDGVLAMYHDQGLAPFKSLAINGGVNFSACLPYVRTSPDHGTAFDIAWKGEADAKSMRDAIYAALDIYRRREIFKEASANPIKKYVHERPERNERFDKNQIKNELKEESND